MAGIPTQQKIILSERQTDYNPEEEITIKIEPTDVALMNGKNTFLRFQVLLSGGQKAELDRKGGGGFALLDRISIYTGNMGTLLEQLEECPCFMGTQFKYKNTDGLKNLRNLFEGLGNIATSGNDVDTVLSPYYTNPAVMAGATDFQQVEVCLPLYMSGIFWSETAFPVLATEGLVLKIVLNSARRAVKAKNVDGFVIQRDRTGRLPQSRDLPMLPSYQPPVNPQQAGQEKQPSPDLPQTWEFLDSNALGTGALPAAGVAVTMIDVVRAGGAAVGAWTIAPADVPAMLPAPVPGHIKDNIQCRITGAVTATDALCLNMIGQHLYMGMTTPAGVIQDLGRIDAVTPAGGAAVRFTMDGTYTVAAADTCLTGDNPPVFGCITDGALTADGGASPAPSFVVKKVELVASVVEPAGAYFDAMVSRLQSKSGLEMDIKSFNLYRSNLYKNQTKSQHLLPTTEYRARAVLQSMICPTETFNHSAYEPLADEMSHYQYNIANKLVPNRRVVCDREHDPTSNSWNELLDAERTKTLNASKVEVLTETHPSGRPVFGRELAKRGHSFDANTHEIRLTQDWGCNQRQGGNAGAVAIRMVTPQYDKLLYSRVRHFRKLTMKPGNVVVSF